ncbi:hypothetical protein OAU08_01585 [Porticoccaceae bacterium]|jgi:hypothetical protein|nr:hypothetical protein [Porticoccaceae bacterium]MDC3248903.1 hypothetical protein [Porticoccaceae bacterium]
MRQQTTVGMSGWLKGLMQTNHLGAIVALSFSLILSACGGGGGNTTDFSAEPGPDGVAPTLTEVTIANAFDSSDEVKLGDTVLLEFTASESLMKPTVVISGTQVTVSGQHSSWSAERLMVEGDEDGAVTFTISFTDVSGVAGIDVTSTTDETYVTYCAAGCPEEGEEEGIAGDWKLSPEAGAFGVGPAKGDTSWYASGEADIAGRACLFDDVYRFGADGTFSNVMGDESWIEAWQGAATDACGALVAPHDGSNAATYVHDEAASTLSLSGLGAHIGLAKVVNGGELASPADAVTDIVYEVTAMTATTMTLDIEIAGGGYWRFKLVKILPPAIAGDWKLAPEAGAFGVGPALGDTSWYASGEADIAGRACLFDDIYRFGTDGTFSNVMGDESWIEAWQGAATDACGALVAPHDGSNAATYVYDEAGASITVNGLGAHIGLAKVFNGGELASPADAKESITYTITAQTDTTMTLDIEIAGGGYWRFKLVKILPPAIAGDWKLAPEAGAFGVGPALGDTSWYASGEADIAGRACLFDDIYRFGTDGTFSNVMGDESWIEAWQGAATDACGALVAPHDGSNAATFVYDEAASTLAVSGLGAHIGLAKVYNGGELSSPADAVTDIVYTITAMTATTMTLDIEIAGGGYWRFKLAKQ